jgi:hypothetical protein
MPTPGIFWRIIVAVICFLAFNALLGPVSRIIGVSITGDAETVIRICLGLIALFYIWRGPALSWGPPA